MIIKNALLKRKYYNKMLTKTGVFLFIIAY
jgi:hypothetical protein